MRFQSELAFMHETVLECSQNVEGRDAVWQAAPVFASIPYSSRCINSLEEFAEAVRIKIPGLGSHGEKRAFKAFMRMDDTITKPSYLKRLGGKFNGSQFTQIEILEERFTREPPSGGLVFSIFNPEDLLARRRPGYTPCIVSGSFLLHKNELHINAFFRSQSILEFGVYDLIFLRKFQSEFFRSVMSRPREYFPKRSYPENIKIGPLNLHFARVIIQSRLARRKSSFLKRLDVVDTWMGLLVDIIDQQAFEGYPSREFDHTIPLELNRSFR